MQDTSIAARVVAMEGVGVHPGMVATVAALPEITVQPLLIHTANLGGF